MNSSSVVDPTFELLWQRAFQVGPGFKGKRDTPSLEECRAIASELLSNGFSVPAYLTTPADWVDREAKIFEAGEFPDKGVSVTEAHLDAIIHGFTHPAPVLIEHADSPLEIGYLTAVERRGADLFGTISLTAEADRLIERSNAKSLSVGLSPDLTQIREVSLVRNPRIADAQLFTFSGSLESIDWKARYEQHLAAERNERAAAQVKALVKTGKLLPCQAQFARALLTQEQCVNFDGQSMPVAGLVTALLERQPKLVKFQETAPNGKSEDYSAQLLLPEEVDFYQKHFPDIDLDQIAARKARV